MMTDRMKPEEPSSLTSLPYFTGADPSDTLVLPAHAGKPSVMVFSSPNPALYNLELVKGANGNFELKRR